MSDAALDLTQQSFIAAFAARDVREHRIGAGLSEAEPGLRLRYEIMRKFAPDIRVSHGRCIGRIAHLARGRGGAVTTSPVVATRIWF